MKKYLLVLLISFPLFAQTRNLIEYANKLEKKIQIGSTFDEVKKIFGKPNAISPGFPADTKSTFIIKDAELSGQLVFTSWVYLSNIVTLEHDILAQGLCWLNGKIVTSDTYQEYEGEMFIYEIEGAPISKSSAKGYQLLKDRRLKKVEKNILECGKIISKKSSGSFIPVVYIVFEKSSQMVASVKVYLKPTINYSEY